MNGVNMIMLGGRLTRDPNIRHTDNGKPLTIANFSIAVNRDYKDKDGNYLTDYFDCNAFGNTANFVEKYCQKGTSVVITGELRNNRYKDKNGNEVYGQVIQVNKLTMAESRKETRTDKADEGIRPEDAVMDPVQSGMIQNEGDPSAAVYDDLSENTDAGYGYRAR